MKIRKATYQDAPFIKLLLEAQGYQTSNSLLVQQLDQAFGTQHHEVIVCEDQGEVTGFAVLHFLPQPASGKSVLLISRLTVDERTKDQSVARALEAHIAELAHERNCESIQVNGAPGRSQAPQFFSGLGYEVSPQYYTKKIS